MWPIAGAQAAVTYDTRVLSDHTVPGTAPGVVYANLGAPIINSTGQIAFESSLTGLGVDSTNNSGIWSEGSGSLGLIARTGDAAPDTAPGTVYSSLANLDFNDAGQTAFGGSLVGTGVDASNNAGIWSEGFGSLSLIARAGDPAPGTTPGVVYRSDFFGRPLLNSAGQIAFTGTLSGPGVVVSNSSGIWSEGSDALGIVARSGDAAVGTAPGVAYSGFNSAINAFNNAGQIAFKGFLVGTDVHSLNNTGIWLGVSSSLSLVARGGDAPPGADPGFIYRAFYPPVINDAGQTAFVGSTAPTGSGIWSESSGSLSLVAKKGDAAPGTVPGVVFGNFFSVFPKFDNVGQPVLNNAGQAAFVGSLSGPGVDFTNNTGIWSEGFGSLSLIAREGDAALETDPGVVYTEFRHNPVLNDAGQIAFIGFLAGTGVDGTNDSGIWATDTNGLLTLIVRAGDLFDVNDDPLIDDFRTISFFDMATGTDTLDTQETGTGFNDAGQLAFAINFTDGSSGIFIASMGSIPLTGDLDGNGLVDILDLNIVLINWNTDGSADPRADTDGNGLVDILDLNVVLADWNMSTPPVSASIPEPASLVVLGLGLPILMRRRRGTTR